MPSAVADALLPAPVNPAQPPQGFWGNAGRFAYDALGLGDVAKALQGQMTPTEAQDFAFGAAMGLIPMSRGLKPVQKGIRAYHGSPHDFDRFDMSKIGTGEGAQAYGHGLYFAENPQVAETYKYVHGGGVPAVDAFKYKGNYVSGVSGVGRAALHSAGAADLGMSGGLRGFPPGGVDASIPNFGVGATPAKLKDVFPSYSDDEITALGTLINSKGDKEKAIEILKMRGRHDAARIVSDAAKDFSVIKMSGPQAHMYEVNINAHPDQFLDWDKPLNSQAAAAGIAQNPAGKWLLEQGNATGKEGYHYVTGNLSKDPVAATNALREAGIPGIKYLDQGSRTAGEGSRNYVVFDDKLIDIIKKYGLAALGLPPAMTAGSQIWNSQTQQ
jgi:hypothetical protein